MRVLSYNIRGGLGMDGRRSINRIADVIRSQNPDIICLQEVHQRLLYGDFANQPDNLKQLLNMPCYFQRNLNFVFGGYGIAIASRYPAMVKSHHFLPSRGERRGALEIQFETLHGLITVFCTHWGLSAEERLLQAEQMALWVRLISNPVIICGDFNEEVGGVRSKCCLSDRAYTIRMPFFSGLLFLPLLPKHVSIIFSTHLR